VTGRHAFGAWKQLVITPAIGLRQDLGSGKLMHRCLEDLPRIAGVKANLLLELGPSFAGNWSIASILRRCWH
jgi:hypothetical protein